MEHVSGCWFPPNEKLLLKIQSGLRTGVYDDNIEALALEISHDLSLFAYCLRELSEMAREAGEEAAPVGPLTALRRAGIEQLKTVLNVESKKICPDSLNAISDSQLSRFQELMVSVATSATLSQHYAIDYELAIGAALVRQLGYTLIAWAYPTEYEKAISECSDATSIDHLLTQAFGFSPSLLGFRVAKRWNLLPEIYRATDTGGDIVEYGNRKAEEIERVSGLLVQISRVGEALARANNPGRYPSAILDFEFARTEIEKALGAPGLQNIRDQLEIHCRHYVELMPHIFRGAFELDPAARIEGHQKLGDDSRLLAQCRPFLRKKLERLYGLIKPASPSKDALQLLARDIIPSAGFIRGVVYLLEPASMSLVPQLAIAGSSVSEYSVVDYTPQSSRGSFVAEAFQSAAPLCRAFTPEHEGKVVSIAGALGQEPRLGVLYLEMGAEIFDGDEAQQLTHFRALARLMTCCFGIE